MPVATSALITTLEEAREYYAEHIAGARTLTVGKERTTIVFERDATHLYSEGGRPEDPALLVARRIPKGKSVEIEERTFSLARARLLDDVLRAISLFTVSVPDGGGRPGFQKTIVYGPPLPTSEYLRVVLRPGPGDSRTCVSAYPVDAAAHAAARRLKRARFP